MGESNSFFYTAVWFAACKPYNDTGNVQRPTSTDIVCKNNPCTWKAAYNSAIVFVYDKE